MLDRWLSGLSPTACTLLAAERSAREGEGLKARALERAEATLEGERWSGVALRQAERGLFGFKTRTLRGALLAAAAVAVAGLAAASVRLFADDTPNVRPALPAVVPPVAAKRAPSLEQRPSAALEAEALATQEPTPTPGAPNGVTRARASGAKQYAIELALLEPARSSIARGDYSAALGAIAQHQREYPSGQLTQEREALRVRALWGLGQKPAAEAAAATFRRRYPRSVLLSWMKGQPAP